MIFSSVSVFDPSYRYSNWYIFVEQSAAWQRYLCVPVLLFPYLYTCVFPHLGHFTFTVAIYFTSFCYYYTMLQLFYAHNQIKESGGRPIRISVIRLNSRKCNRTFWS